MGSGQRSKVNFSDHPVLLRRPSCADNSQGTGSYTAPTNVEMVRALLEAAVMSLECALGSVKGSSAIGS